MTQADLAYFVRQQGRMRGLQSGMITVLVNAFEVLRESMSDAQLEALIRTGDTGQIIDALLSGTFDRATIPVTEQLRQIVMTAFRQTITDLPAGGKIDGQVAVAFGHLNPDVIAALTELQTTVLDGLRADVKAAVLAAVKDGIENGDSVSAIASTLRGVIGLSGSQTQEVLNFRDALMGTNGRSVTDYTLRNRIVDKLMRDNGALTPAQVDRYTQAYRDARIAQNTKTVAGTAMKEAYRQGQHMSWAAAKDSGVIPDGYDMMRQWIGVGDDRERDEHLIMNDEVTGFEEPFSNGDMIVGEGSPWNCRCVERVFLVKSDAADEMAA